MIPPTAWRPIRPEQLALRHWDGEFVAYNPLSGNTHFLDDVLGALLDAITRGRGTEAELIELADTLIEYPDEASRAEDVRFMLGTLSDLGLIEPTSPC